MLHMLTCTAGLQQTAVGPLLTITAALCAPTAQLLGLLQIHQPGAALQASFVTTWMEPQAEELISESLNVNYVDTEEVRCVQLGWCVAPTSLSAGSAARVAALCPSKLLAASSAAQLSNATAPHAGPAELCSLLPVPPPLQYPSSTEIHNR